MQNLKNYQLSYLDRDKDFLLAMQSLCQEELIALDTEFCRKKTYFPILSTIQIASFRGQKPQVFIVDCMAISNLKPFIEMLDNNKIIKVFHCALQDLQILLKLSKSKPKAIFDTQIMANFCGHEFNIGYGNLVEKLFSQKIDKEQQVSDWKQRPLSQNQLNYAATDVIYLGKIFEHFYAQIEKSGRLDWLEEEMEILLQRCLRGGSENLIKKFDIAHKSQNEIGQLQKLIDWRENVAQKLDIPRQHVVRDEILEEITCNEGLSLKISKKISSNFLPEILEIIKSFVIDSELEKRAFFTISDSLHRDFIKKLQKIVRHEAEFHGISEQFLLSKSFISGIIAEKNCRKILNNWRYQLLHEKFEPIILKLTQ